jgi:predicted ester cyclase
LTAKKGGDITSVEANKALVRKMIDASNTKDQAMIDMFLEEHMAVDFVDHHGQVHGRENVKQAYKMVLKDYPDMRRTLENIIAEGDKVWFLENVTGTNASGQKMDVTALTIIRIVNGQAVEGWGGYLQQTP